MVKPIQEDGNFVTMLQTNHNDKESTIISFKELLKAKDEVKKVSFDEEAALLMLKIRRQLHNNGIYATDRTYNNSVNILKAEAYFNGRTGVKEEDFVVLKDVLWSDPKQEREVWSTVLQMVSPETAGVVKLYEKALDVVNAVNAETSKEKRRFKSIEAQSKLKDVVAEVTEIIETLKEKKRDTKQAESYKMKLDALHYDLFANNMGVVPNAKIKR